MKRRIFKYVATFAISSYVLLLNPKNVLASEQCIIEIEPNYVVAQTTDAINFDEDIQYDYTNLYSSISSQTVKYKNDYGYRDLVNRSNSEGRKGFYAAIESVCNEYALSDASLTEKTYFGEYIIATINYNAYGLTKEEAIETYVTYKYDNPQYFWIDNYVSYSTAGYIYITGWEEYAQADIRKGYEELVENKVNEYKKVVNSYDTDYQKIKAVHDYIISEVDYAYDDAGLPLDEVYAHNILGVLDTSNKGAVCEGYAKTFSLILNAIGVDNAYVVGYAGGGHAWNIAKMPDGNYYNFDVTWDDAKSEGALYYYFAKGKNFDLTHTPYTPENSGVTFLYDLPQIAEKDYEKTEADEPKQVDPNDVLIELGVKTVTSSYGQYIQIAGIEGGIIQGYSEHSGWGKEGVTCGVNNENLQAIRCISNDKNKNIYYRVYIEEYGWLNWASNGEISGTVGIGNNIKTIQYLITDSKTAPQVTSDVPFKNIVNAANYASHVQDHGDMGYCLPGTLSGTTHESRRIEGFFIRSNVEGLGFHMKGHIQINGDVESDDGYIGTKGESKRLEALTITLTGEKANMYNLYYKGHVQIDGWSDYMEAGKRLGTDHQSKRLEGIILIIESKDTGVQSN